MWLRGLILGPLAFALYACGGDDDPTTDPDSDRDQRLERAKELCTTRCELEIAAGCDATPENYLSACVALCSDKYRYYAGCDSELTALDECRVELGTYTCDDNGFPLIGPLGVCADQGAACMACTKSNVLSCL